MRASQSKQEGTSWGDFTKNEAEQYYNKLGIKCALLEEYQHWFKMAERANSKCRTLKSFCDSCTAEYETEQREVGNCIKPEPAKN